MSEPDNKMPELGPALSALFKAVRSEKENRSIATLLAWTDLSPEEARAFHAAITEPARGDITENWETSDALARATRIAADVLGTNPFMAEWFLLVWQPFREDPVEYLPDIPSHEALWELSSVGNGPRVMKDGVVLALAHSTRVPWSVLAIVSERAHVRLMPESELRFAAFPDRDSSAAVLVSRKEASEIMGVLLSNGLPEELVLPPGLSSIPREVSATRISSVAACSTWRR